MRLRWVLGALLLLGSVLWLFAEVVFQGKVLFFGDLSLYFLPQLTFERKELLAGRLPLWNPYIFCGQPFVGNPQTWPLYPSALALGLWEAERANAFSTVSHVLWLALGMLLFLRHRGLGATAATLGALSFSCGGAVISKAQFPNMLQAESWLPWLLLSADRLLQLQTSGRIAVLALCGGLALLAAHAQISMMQFYVVLAWCLFRLPHRGALQPFGALLLAGLLGLGVAAGQLLPVLDHVQASVRPQLLLAQANRFYLPFNELLLLVWPNTFGNPATSHPWRAPGNFWEPCCYVGVIPLSLACVGVLRLRGLSAEARFWLGVALVGLWLALGRYGGLYSVVFSVLPGVKQFHDPARFLYLATFGMALLAAHVFQDLLSSRRGWQVATLILAAVDLISFSRTLNPTTDLATLARGREQLAARLAGVDRVFHTEPYRPWHRWVSYQTYSTVASKDEQVAFLASATPNLPFWVGVRQAGGYEPVVRKDINERLARLGPLPQTPQSLASWQVMFLEELGVGLILGYDPATGQVTQRRLASSRPPTQGAELRYDPTLWRVGVFVSLSTACILGALLIQTVRSRSWRT